MRPKGSSLVEALRWLFSFMRAGLRIEFPLVLPPTRHATSVRAHGASKSTRVHRHVIGQSAFRSPSGSTRVAKHGLFRRPISPQRSCCQGQMNTHVSKQAGNLPRLLKARPESMTIQHTCPPDSTTYQVTKVRKGWRTYWRCHSGHTVLASPYALRGFATKQPICSSLGQPLCFQKPCSLSSFAAARIRFQGCAQTEHNGTKRGRDKENQEESSQLAHTSGDRSHTTRCYEAMPLRE